MYVCLYMYIYMYAMYVYFFRWILCSIKRGLRGSIDGLELNCDVTKPRAHSGCIDREFGGNRAPVAVI